MRIVYVLAIIGVVLPPAVVPMVFLMRGIGLQGTLPALILFTVGMRVSLVVFLLTGFARGLPVELEEVGSIGMDAWLACLAFLLLAAAVADDLADLPDIGPIVGNTVVSFLGSDDGAGLIDDLKNAGFFLDQELLPPPEVVSVGHTWFAGKVFVLTGTLHRMKRAEAKSAIHSMAAAF